MDKIKVTYTHDGAVAQILLDDGKGNVLDQVMMAELQATLSNLSTDNRLKLLLFEGAGKHFSFGASVEEHRKEQAAAMLRGFHHLFYTLRDLSLPTAAKISGQCLGGGLELALMCNFLFADQTAKLGQPEVILGVFPPPASILLCEKIGQARAEELLITGQTIPAETAKAIGLVNELYPDRETMDREVEAWIAQHILPKSASSLSFAVKAARARLNHLLNVFLPQLEHLYVHELMETHDANEGINAFLEKRKPVWDNH